MTITAPAREWEQRVTVLWDTIDDHGAEDFRGLVQALADELPAGHPVAYFELASANDATELPGEAAVLYRRALDAGLAGYRRRRAVIQLASTLRNLGHAGESVELLLAERSVDPASLDEATVGLADAVDAFLALALTDVGREREAASVALAALAAHLPRYSRSLVYYAGVLGEPSGA